MALRNPCYGMLVSPDLEILFHSYRRLARLSESQHFGFYYIVHLVQHFGFYYIVQHFGKHPCSHTTHTLHRSVAELPAFYEGLQYSSAHDHPLA